MKTWSAPIPFATILGCNTGDVTRLAQSNKNQMLGAPHVYRCPLALNNEPTSFFLEAPVLIVYGNLGSKKLLF